MSCGRSITPPTDPEGGGSAGRSRACWAAGLLLGALVVWLAPPTASAHESAPGVLAMQEVAPQRFAVRWSPPSPDAPDLRIEFPARCTLPWGDNAVQAVKVQVPTRVDCPGGLVGRVRFLSALPIGRVGVNVVWLDERAAFRLTDGAPPAVTFEAAPQAGAARVFVDYVALGVEHIWVGVDHLLFLVGLILLVRSRRALLWTISAFTLAHSITLAASSLDLLTIAAAPVEICIALSVLLLAVEATAAERSMTRSYPWLVAFAFGLLHGFGFASALSEMGLPENAVATALLAFNLGVEAGQLAFVATIAALLRALTPWPHWRRRFEVGAIWALGISSVFWLLQRVGGWLSELRLL